MTFNVEAEMYCLLEDIQKICTDLEYGADELTPKEALEIIHELIDDYWAQIRVDVIGESGAVEMEFSFLNERDKQ